MQSARLTTLLTSHLVVALIALVGIGGATRVMEAGLAFVPGSAFGAPGYLRLSYALDFNSLSDAMERLKQCLG